jgi:hypothetical protein
LLSEETGIKIMIHGHNHTPFLEHRGFSIRPGTKTTIGIREVGGAPEPSAQSRPWGRGGASRGWAELKPLPPG